MKLIKLNLMDSQSIGSATNIIARQTPQKNEADKAIKSAKEIIARELLRLRDIAIESLPEKETVVIEFCGLNGGLKLDRKGRDMFDLESFRVAHPELVKQFTKRNVATYFEPLL